ncbi:MAG: dinitrogenase iron-molybdenum cofactor biosynthesis protein [Deltaproteobacteria bacterium]|nr:dinitrogenase iron-molybdenum cofactor biosynthesis protein [Deltaproteobacteria bacterium]MBW2017696.1 dinitrogenase iron-molybdenum cofactor biosynthesis protein [Deltaproteobacteria bacterium]MBW2130368.1 dinitrogenase iron-molybdenum cofactor biosynthesis protein [Deltaproteobacteria bacterium]MBW2303409.1 dinitrogenase iron-molybdenum cofactor biosynthesis protein [Deltaproteobacteria bacterium]
MPKKILIPLHENDVAPRFDLATEVLVVKRGKGTRNPEERILILPHPSSEELCHLIMTEGVDTVICGGIEEEYYDYLIWKKVQVLDNVIGPSREVLKRYCRGRLKSGDILHPPG